MRLWQQYLNADSNRNAQECQKAPRYKFLLIWRHRTLHRLQTCASVCSGRKQEMPVFLDIGILESCKASSCLQSSSYTSSSSTSWASSSMAWTRRSRRAGVAASRSGCCCGWRAWAGAWVAGWA